MAAPTFRAAATVQSTNTLSLTMSNAPAGLTTDDIEFLVVETADEAVTLSTTGGFTEVTGSPISMPSATASIKTRGTVFWRRYAGQADPVIAAVTDHIVAQRYAFAGCETTGDPWDFIQTSSENVQDTSGVATGGTTLGADRFIAIIIGSSKPDLTTDNTDVSGWTNANLPDLTERADNSRPEGNGGAVGLATGTLASAGSTGDTSYTKSVSAWKWHFVIGLKPLAAGGSTTTLTADAGTFNLNGQAALFQVQQVVDYGSFS